MSQSVVNGGPLNSHCKSSDCETEVSFKVIFNILLSNLSPLLDSVHQVETVRVEHSETKTLGNNIFDRSFRPRERCFIPKTAQDLEGDLVF